jgi:phage gp16-like protein
MPDDKTRLRDLKLIHAAARQMAWDENTYRAILERVAGQPSAATLTARQRKQVLDEFARLGWKVKASKGHRAPRKNAAPATPADLSLTGPGWGKDRLLAKIGALLADAGRGWAYADGCARKMFGLESVRFCDPDQLHRIVAALTYDQQRRAKRPGTGK